MRSARMKVFAARATLRALTLLVTTATVAADTPPKRPNLQGSWSFNAYLTAQIARDQQGQGREESSSGGWGRHGRTGDGSGRGGSGGGSRGGRRPEGGDEQGGDPSPAAGKDRAAGQAGEGSQDGEALDALTIVQDGDQVTITDRRGRARVLKADGAKVRSEIAPGRTVQLKTKWDEDGALRVEIQPDKGPRRTESYLVANDGKHLYVTVTREDGRAQGGTTRAYDRAEPPAAQAPPPQR
jgi:hypothetical protein